MCRFKEILGHANYQDDDGLRHLKPEALNKEMAKTFRQGPRQERSELERLRVLLAVKDDQVQRLEAQVHELRTVARL